MQRGRALSYALLPAVVVAAFTLAWFTFRTTLQLDKLRQQSVLEATLALANEKADRLDKRIITEDNTVFAIAEPAELSTLTERWVPTAQRETPTIRAILMLDDAHDVLAFASRVGGAWGEEEEFRRLLVHRLLPDIDLSAQPENELRHLHKEYEGQSYLVSYWQRVAGEAQVHRRRVARHRAHREGDAPRALQRACSPRAGRRAEPPQRRRRAGSHHLRPAPPERRVHRRREVPDDALQLAPSGVPRGERGDRPERPEPQDARDGPRDPLVRRHRRGRC